MVKAIKEVTEEDKRRDEIMSRRPPLDEILNLHDFESVAKAVLPAKAWAYYSSAADDEITIRENHNAFRNLVQLGMWASYNEEVRSSRHSSMTLLKRCRTDRRSANRDADLPHRQYLRRAV